MTQHGDRNAPADAWGVSATAPPVQRSATSGKSITAFVLGVLSIVGACLCGILSPIVVIPCSITGISLAVCSRKDSGRQGLGTAGLILSICGLCISLLFVTVMIIAIVFQDHPPEEL